MIIMLFIFVMRLILMVFSPIICRFNRLQSQLLLPVVARSYLCQTILPMLLMPNGQRWTLNLLMAKSIPSLSFWISFFFLRLSLSKFYYSSNTCLKIVVTSMSSRPMETFVFFLSFNNLIHKYFNFCHH